MTDQPVVVWCEIPVTDMQKACDFYAEVFGFTMTIDDTGPNPMATLGTNMETVAGHLYPGKPAVGNGPTVHLAVPGALSEAVDRCKLAGGTIVSPPIEIPPGKFVYATDPDGNSLGLFEPKG